MKKRRLLVTSALPYSNGDLHLGHLFEYLQTDFWVRFQKMRGHECVYFCADDTHGTPVMLAAKKQGLTPKALIAEKRQQHLADFKAFEVNFTHYSSTDSDDNRRLSHLVFKAMQQQGHLSVKAIEQSYCDSCRMFLPDRFVKGACPRCEAEAQYGDSCEVCGATYSPKELKAPTCVTCGAVPVYRQSEHLFFELDHFRAFLREWIKNHTAQEVANKLEEWFKDGAPLRAWDISRDPPYFGFEIPGYPNKYFYVWVDAPVGYIAATEEWAKPRGESYRHYWEGQNFEIYHFIGKDIIYFHSLFWPAMLKAAGLSTPTKIMAHGFLTLNGQKMSKSKGYFINAKTYLERLEPLYLRYYLAAKTMPTISDADFNLTDFVNRNNAELIGKITNLASRGAQLLGRKLDGRLGRLTQWGQAQLAAHQRQSETIAGYYEEREFAKVILAVREVAEQANRYFDEQAPWKMAAGEEQRGVLTDVLLVFRVMAIWLTPIIPSYSRKVAALFQEGGYTWASLEEVPEGRPLAPFEPLARRLTQAEAEALLR